MKLNELLKVLRGNRVSIVDYESDKELYFGHSASILKEVDNLENYEIEDVMQCRRENYLIIEVKEVK